MINPALLVESRRLLNRARLVAEAPAAQSSEIGHGQPASSIPPGTFTGQVSTLGACGERINHAIAAGSEEQLRRANKWCEGELRGLQHAAERGAETHLEFRDRVCASYEGVLAGVVARQERTSVTTVRKLRAEGGRDPRTGYKLAPAVDSARCSPPTGSRI